MSIVVCDKDASLLNDKSKILAMPAYRDIKDQALRDLVDSKFKSGNDIEVDRITITRAEYLACNNNPIE